MDDGIETIPLIEDVSIGEMILLHARMEIELRQRHLGEHGEDAAIRDMRKHVAWYTAGLRYSAALRARVNEINTYAQLEEMIHTKLCGQ